MMYKIHQYKIEAESLTKACQKLANLGLLKGHKLQALEGSTIEVEYACYSKTGLGSLYRKLPRATSGRVVFSASENYHSPAQLTILKQEDGQYKIVQTERSGKATIEPCNLQTAWATAKEASKWRGYHHSGWHYPPLN